MMKANENNKSLTLESLGYEKKSRSTYSSKSVRQYEKVIKKGMTDIIVIDMFTQMITKYLVKDGIGTSLTSLTFEEMKAINEMLMLSSNRK